ncbi:MAG: hypothetical protein JWM10_1235, partial [Myxococcaceae bacterium]|nr:hypothetical protein [Myxococcaceae bacterium]
VAAVAPGCDGADPDADFADHTVARLAAAPDYDALATTAFGLSSLKFVITAFGDGARRDLRFQDGRFYRLHDEWYWFRLLNGARVPGDDVAPVSGGDFASVAAIVQWARGRSALPLDLLFVDDGRLYSPRFYERAVGPARRYGVGSLVRVPARAGAPERWAFELEYGDEPTHAQLVVFFEALAARLPPAVAGALRFLVRSTAQEALAARMERERLPYADRLLRYADLVVPGAREVYSDGVTAGRLRVVRRGEAAVDATPDDVLVFAESPDALPPAAGVITAVPQTPLAHVNLLARNRGIPNAYLAGVLDDAEVDQLARGHAPVVLLAASPGRVVLAPITEEQFRRYGALLSHPARAVTTPPLAAMPYLVDLAARDPAEIAALASTVGGKSMGMIALVREPGLDAPDRPHGITVRAYAEHLAPLRERVAALLSDPAFEGDPRARLLTLEGDAAYRARRNSPADGLWADGFLRAHGPSTPLGSLARGGGVRGLVESTPIDPATLAEIERTLRAAYAQLAPTQGIRFRSSSNVEDIEGFNGAGLYESYTGFLDPAAQPRASDRDKTVERSILRVWGSYWSFEAFEERRLERIDHLSAAMGVLVHPRFDDELERATGVCTVTLLPPGDPDAERLDVNVQAGDGSVANPDPQVLPEVLRVLRGRDGAVRIERVRRSTLAPDRALLDDVALRRLLDDTAAVARRWLDRENAARPAAQRARGITLDYEFHDMAAGWPARREGDARPARLVLKQVRTLEPGARVRVADAPSWPVPRDVFVRARRVVAEECRAELAPGVAVTVTTLRVLTDPSLPPDVGFASAPFDASLSLALSGPLPGLALAANLAADHTGYAASATGAARTYRFDAPTAARLGLDRVTIDPGGDVALARGDRAASGRASCRDDVRFTGARDYLLGLLPGS